MWNNKNKKKKTLFQRITGGISLRDKEEELEEDFEEEGDSFGLNSKKLTIKDSNSSWEEELEQDGQLSVDVYQTPSEIVVVSMVAGVRPEDLQVNITRDMITIRGKREENRTISDENFFTRELYWGTFSRTILLPQEIEPEEAEATEKHGLLIIRLPKIDKGKKSTLRVKSL